MSDSLRSVQEYQIPLFEGARYERVGEQAQPELFEPIQPEVISGSNHVMIDPMFADYGGRSTGECPTQPYGSEGTCFPEEGSLSSSSASLDSAEFQQLLVEERARGFAEGQSEAQERVDAEIASIRNQFSTLCDELSSKLHQEIERIERQAIGISILISRRIVAEAVEINPEYLLPIVREALGYVGGAEVHRVRISPADLEFVEIEKIRERFDGSWSFVADSSIVSGCVIETNAGEVDYRLDAAWERLKEQVVRSITA